MDMGGSASAGSVFGKLNAVIAYLLGYVTTALTNVGNYAKRLNDLFTDARVAKIDTIDANTAANHTPSATGTISQKLSKVIADLTAIVTGMNEAKKRLTSKWGSFDLTAYTNKTVAVLNVSGAGVFRGAYTNNFSNNNCSNIRVTLDGAAYNIATSSGSAYILGRSVTAERFPLMLTSNPAYIIPLPFKTGLKIEMTLTSSVSSSMFTANYDIYE